MNLQIKTCNHKFVFKYVEKTSHENGYRGRKYVKTDYYFCEKCLENKEVVEEVQVNINYPEQIPAWAYSGITRY